MTSGTYSGELCLLFKVSWIDFQSSCDAKASCLCVATVITPLIYQNSLFNADRVEFTQLAAAYSKVNLGQGFPDFGPPKFVQEAFCQALNEGPTMHQYTRAFVSHVTTLAQSLKKTIF